VSWVRTGAPPCTAVPILTLFSGHALVGFMCQAVLELSPRYPLFGGWSTTFTLGYSVPLDTMVSIGKDGTRGLNTSFGTPFQELPIKHLTVKVR